MARLSLEQVVSSFYKALYHFALSLTGQPGDASDLTQETFYIWATKGHQLRDEAKVKTWLFTTLYRQHLNSRQRESRLPHCELAAVDSQLPVVSPAMVEQMDTATVMAAVGRIDEIHRVPLTLFYLEEHSKILAVESVRPLASQWRRTSWLAAAALLALLAIAAFWLPSRPTSQFGAYRDSMTDFLSARFDHLDFKARDVTQLKQFLAQRGAPSDFVLPNGLSELPSYGCRVLTWDGHMVSLICFHLAGNKQIHLFVIQGTKFAEAPPTSSFQFASSSGWTTASWQRGNTAYLLAGSGDRAYLQKYL